MQHHTVRRAEALRYPSAEINLVLNHHQRLTCKRKRLFLDVLGVGVGVLFHFRGVQFILFQLVQPSAVCTPGHDREIALQLQLTNCMGKRAFAGVRCPLVRDRRLQPCRRRAGNPPRRRRSPQQGMSFGRHQIATPNCRRRSAYAPYCSGGSWSSPMTPNSALSAVSAAERSAVLAGSA